MNKCVSRGLWGVLFVGGLSLLGVGTAHADEASTSGDGSLLGGNQAIVEVTAPVTANGNAVSVFGDAESDDATTKVESGDGGDDQKVKTSGDKSILGGNQAIVEVTAPVTANGNAVSVFGDAESDDATTKVESGDGGKGDKGKHRDHDRKGEEGKHDVHKCDRGEGHKGHHHDKKWNGHDKGHHHDKKWNGHDEKWNGHGKWNGHDKGKYGKCYADDDRYITSGDYSLLGGNQLIADVFAPVTLNGNAVSVFGDSESEDATTVIRNSDGCKNGTLARTSGDKSILGGNQLIADVVAPLTANGNAVSVFGDSETEDAKTVVLF